VVANARCLGEGIDVPDVDFIAIIDPRRSVIDIMQAVGRSLRLSPGKDIATILIPVVVDSSQDPHGALNVSAFRYVRKTLLAMRSIDNERLGEQLDEIRRQRGKLRAGEAGALKLPPNLRIIMPAKVSANFARAFNVMIVEMARAPFSFENGYNHYLRHIAEGGDPWPKATYRMDDGFNLGMWLRNRRVQKAEGNLPAEQIKLLDAAGMAWNVNDAMWKNTLRHLQDYRAREGDALVPQDHKADDGFPLGVRVAYLRRLYNQDKLPAERIKQLEAVDFQWKPKKGPSVGEIPEHGTYARYQRGCKCAPCRAAAAKYARGQRRLKGVANPTFDDWDDLEDYETDLGEDVPDGRYTVAGQPWDITAAWGYNAKRPPA
jgi:hypothetical protein